ncbi:uncharacterized protein L3040_004430 [Drepanopeziza brunnea f. sp. 'multigermtubi']|uniref:uncharacterized protein n=1 Tax=Drepanopeziza brunnea f. sp. 'multigermtubi' TaxID=698441 RepID=UPI0023915E69|nr:hypothetical protein L3040_004430 [Drepanopeziza brunnea f. sp. 'multigermtubi']
MIFGSTRATSAIQGRRKSNMAVSVLAIVVALLSPTSALQVTPDSACSSVCIDVPTSDISEPDVSNTSASEIVCRDDDYSTGQAGYTYSTCLNCLQNSSASKFDENDQAWYFYNLRYALNSCIFGTTNATDPISTPCGTSSVCGRIQLALAHGMQTPSTTGQYSYCTAYDNSFLGSGLDICQECLRLNSESSYLANFLTALRAGCTQRPGKGLVVGLNSTLFTKYEVAITFPHNPSAAAREKRKGLSTESIVGMAVSCGVLLLILVAIAIICIRKRRNTRRLNRFQRPLHERFGAENITAPNRGAFSSTQNSPPLKEEVQMSRAPKVRNISLSRQLPQRAGEWQGIQPSWEINSPNPPSYSPPRRDGDSLPAHHAYIPPEYTPPSRNSTSPLYFPPPASPPQQSPQPLPASHPQRMSLPATESQQKDSLPVAPSTSLSRGPSIDSRIVPNRQEASMDTRRLSNTPPSLPGPLGPGLPRTSNNTALPDPPIMGSGNNSDPSSSTSSSITPSVPPLQRQQNPGTGTSSPSHSRHPSTAARIQIQNLGVRRGFVPSPVQTTAAAAASVTQCGEHAPQGARGGMGMYREGVGGTRAHGPETVEAVERPRPDSDASEELWPGRY